MFNLALAIVSEVAATTLLPMTLGFSKILPSIGCAIGYVCAFYFLSLATAAGMSSATAYAIWCGAGIILVAFVQALMGNIPNMNTVLGMIMIVSGVVLINLGGNVSH
ncbi:SMR family transporter [Photobacterium sp. SDRW27]|uniref:DMT family transporter n=1 Tax=Photobacterium obscurum TaxID=2829490 RepID=UPI002242EB57|nr:SMR family transporter [Photobacterium obscurum]MCW8330844.1 SMR family transporter [Photobacterium obscurum]